MDFRALNIPLLFLDNPFIPFTFTVEELINTKATLDLIYYYNLFKFIIISIFSILLIEYNVFLSIFIKIIFLFT
jgi:hypothetical protein